MTVVRQSAERVPKKAQPKGGSRKGRPNKITRELKAMILQALDEAGGVQYLVAQAKNPRTAAAFLTLLGKVLPLQVTGADGRTLAQELAGLNAETKAPDAD